MLIESCLRKEVPDIVKWGEPSYKSPTAPKTDYAYAIAFLSHKEDYRWNYNTYSTLEIKNFIF